MGKLHELLAVEPELKGAAEKILSETLSTFTKKQPHFYGQLRTYQPLDDEGQPEEPQRQDMQTSVWDKLQHTNKVLSRYLNAVAEKETTNTKAKAIVTIGDMKLELPATLLLALEGRFREIRTVIDRAPTLDPTEAWHWDADTKCYATKARYSYKNAKVRKHKVLYEATKEHPAQVEAYTEDDRVGTWTTSKWSGALSPAEKAEVMERLDQVIRELKKARQRANNEEVSPARLAQGLFDYIMTPIKK